MVREGLSQALIVELRLEWWKGKRHTQFMGNMISLISFGDIMPVLTWDMLVKGKLAGCGDCLDTTCHHGFGDSEAEIIIHWNHKHKEGDDFHGLGQEGDEKFILDLLIWHACESVQLQISDELTVICIRSWGKLWATDMRWGHREGVLDFRGGSWNNGSEECPGKKLWNWERTLGT